MQVGVYHKFGILRAPPAAGPVDSGMSCITAVQALVGAVKKLAADPESKDKNRIGVLLGTKQARGTKTLTHVMWVLFNLLPGKTTQKAHRHTPTALDFAVSAPAKGLTATCCCCALLSCFARALLACFVHALLSCFAVMLCCHALLSFIVGPGCLLSVTLPSLQSHPLHAQSYLS